MDPKKIYAVVSWPMSRTIRQLRGFLGLFGYYRRFVAQFASLTKAFKALKFTLGSTQVLALPNFLESFFIQTIFVGIAIRARLFYPNKGAHLHFSASSFALSYKPPLLMSVKCLQSQRMLRSGVNISGPTLVTTFRVPLILLMWTSSLLLGTNL